MIPVVAVAMLAAAGCQSSGGEQAAGPSTPPVVTATTARSSASPSPHGGESETPAATPTSETTSSSGSPSAKGPQDLSLSTGQTARLANFDATLLRSEHGKDGISIGWKVRVCYTSAHPEADADGATRISTDPWSVQVLDGEGGTKAVWSRISEFPADKGWQPPYPERKLALGECSEGWIAVRHENPDLQFQALRYQPAGSGDVVTWSSR